MHSLFISKYKLHRLQDFKRYLANYLISFNKTVIVTCSNYTHLTQLQGTDPLEQIVLLCNRAR